MRSTPDAGPGRAPSIRPSWKGAADGVLGAFWIPQGRCFELQLGTRRDAHGDEVGRLVRLRDVTEMHAVRRQREEMMNFLTHDMRSPQASILAAIATAGPGEIDQNLAGRLEGYARRTLKLADNFVHLARAEMPHYQLELLDLSDLLIDALDDLWPQGQAKQLTFRTSGEQSEWLVHGERSLLTRAMINVIDNAIKFSPPGAEIVCTLQAGTLHGKDAVACAITDRGPGIAEDHLCFLFERFRRGLPATPVPGVGLGLALVQTVLTRHRGEVYCTSEVGKGSTFTLLVPLAPSA
jgi:signal transduction histidine kinase